MKHTNKHITIVDIAKILGLAPSTVSRALNNHPQVNDETKAQIKELAERLNYIPNPIARGLKNNRTTTIGVIVPQIKHDFFSSAISGIENVVYQSGYTIIVCQSNESYEREVLHINMLMNHRVAGVIVSISQTTKNGDHFQELLKKNIPIVFFDRVCDDVTTTKVVIDDYKSAYNAVTFLVRKGYKKIIHFAGPRGVGVYEKRMQGYLDAIRDAQLPIVAEHVVYTGLEVQGGYESMDSLFKENIIPDAIFTVNDPVALGAYKRIKEAGLQIPTDIAAIGFSNNVVSSLVDPPLTTVDQFPFEMGKQTAELLIKMIEGTLREPQTLIIDTELVVRGST
jgi:DNA-binding LacI/PurR family transcriptional regulator